MSGRFLPVMAGLCLLALFPSSAAAADGLSTTFVKVLMRDVPLGKTQPMIAKTGPGITITNLGDNKISVVIDILTPAPAQLWRGAEPIPDVRWIQIAPQSFELEGHETYTVDAELTVPDKRIYRQKHYQAMVWIHSAPEENSALAIGGGLLTRFRFKTAAK